MTAGSTLRRVPPLAATLGLDAIALAALGLALHLGGATAARYLRDDPGVRAVGLALLGLSWLTLLRARQTAVGVRRALARCAGAGLVFAGTAHLAGPTVLGSVDDALPGADLAGGRALAGALALAALTVYAWRTSPARRYDPRPWR